MMDDQILNDFLDNAVNKAKENIKTQGKLATEDAIPLMLKSQFNHIAHLEKEMVTKKDFNAFKGEFNGFKEQFSTLKEQVSGFKEQFSALKEQVSGLKEQFGSLKEQFNGLKEQFNGLKEQFAFVKWLIMFGFTFLAALQIYLGFFK